VKLGIKTIKMHESTTLAPPTCLEDPSGLLEESQPGPGWTCQRARVLSQREETS